MQYGWAVKLIAGVILLFHVACISCLLLGNTGLPAKTHYPRPDSGSLPKQETRAVRKLLLRSTWSLEGKYTLPAFRHPGGYAPTRPNPRDEKEAWSGRDVKKGWGGRDS